MKLKKTLDKFVFPAQVKRELAGVLIFESHANAGTVCKSMKESNQSSHWQPSTTRGQNQTMHRVKYVS